MRRNYTWRLNGKRWQKVTALDMRGNQANTVTVTTNVVQWLTVLKEGPVVK